MVESDLENGNVPNAHTSAFFAAVRSCDLPAVKGGFTALHEAALNGSAPMVRLLMEKGADIDAQTNHGRTALELAGDRSEVVSLIQKQE